MTAVLRAAPGQYRLRNSAWSRFLHTAGLWLLRKAADPDPADRAEIMLAHRNASDRQARRLQAERRYRQLAGPR